MALSDYALFIAYFAIGIAVYSKLEGWSPLDATYFMMTVSTTVGYGDLAPASADGRLFTRVYALLGTTVIISALSPAVAWALGLLRSYYDRVVPLLVDTEDYTLSLKELNQRISYPRRYLRALLGPALLMLVGVLHGIYGGGLGVLDACYFSIITMTTVGFGDLTPTSDADKAFALLYLPLAVTALADALSEIESIKMRRKIRETDHLASPDKLLLAKAAKTRNSNGSYSEGDFLAQVLIHHGLVDEDTVSAVRRQYAEQFSEMFSSAAMEERRQSVQGVVDTLTGGILAADIKDPSMVINAEMVYRELQREGKVEAETVLSGGFKEWFEGEWKAMVEQGDWEAAKAEAEAGWS